MCYLIPCISYGWISDIWNGWYGRAIGVYFSLRSCYAFFLHLFPIFEIIRCDTHRLVIRRLYDTILFSELADLFLQLVACIALSFLGFSYSIGDDLLHHFLQIVVV